MARITLDHPSRKRKEAIIRITSRRFTLALTPIHIHRLTRLFFLNPRPYSPQPHLPSILGIAKATCSGNKQIIFSRMVTRKRMTMAARISRIVHGMADSLKPRKREDAYSGAETILGHLNGTS